MIRNTDIEDVKNMVIDEDKEMMLNYYKEEEGKVKQVNTDHNTVVIEMDYMLSIKKHRTYEKGHQNWMYKIQEGNRRWNNQRCYQTTWEYTRKI